MFTSSVPSSAEGSRLLDAYQPLPGIADELKHPLGLMRPAWSGMIDHLSTLSPDAIEAAFARGDQHLADAGVFYRKYGDPTIPSRDWPYSHIPVIIAEQEWREIAEGLTQRADLLEAVMADLYGSNRLVSDGHLPATLVAQNPEWLRPMVGVKPRSGHFLHFLAFEIGRGPDGRWWVLTDRTDAPSGTGFALENRVASTRVFPELMQRGHVLRLAGFFGGFRDALDALRGDAASRVGLLTPGALTDTYYEQAYIARYLGLSLLEGDDLTVEDGAVKVRTVNGLAPLDVLWRRMDGIWSDPLELREDSRLGTAGLMSAVRQGRITLVNALGAGVLETQALMAFLPRIAHVLLGEGLKMPNIATWWCGQPGELAYVRQNAHRMLIGPARSTRMAYETAATHSIGGRMRGAPAPDLDTWLTGNAPDLVAKELVKLSTTPVFDRGGLVPRPMALRMFLARTRQGWSVMPGGFARIGVDTENPTVSMLSGGSVADVWVLGERAVEPMTLLTTPSDTFVRAPAYPLPSRAADNLFWLGRYTERTEGILRLLRAYHSRMDEEATEPLLAIIRDQLRQMGIDSREALPTGLRACLDSAVRSASRIRDRFSVDAWAALIDMEKSMARLGRTSRPGNDAALAASVMLRKISGLSGLIHENMYRATGWQFLTVGRALERAAMLSELLVAVAGTQAPEGGLDVAIEVGDSVSIHRQRYAVMASRDSVVDLLALDPSNPRSIRFQLDVIRSRAADLRALEPGGPMTDFERGILTLQNEFTVHTAFTLDTAALNRAHQGILDLSTRLDAAYLH
ncbi:circularly permuted type 2 ATP-grasp protein [Sulfitobacter sp. LCG007]